MPNSLGGVRGRLRVCLVSHNYLERRYTGKLRAMAEECDLLVLQPTRLQFPFGTFTASPVDGEPFDTISLPAFYPTGLKTSTRWMLTGLGSHIAAFRPDIIHIENEYHSFITLQAIYHRWRSAPRARIVVSFWQNLPIVGAKATLIRLLGSWARPKISYFFPANDDGRQMLLHDGIQDNCICVLPPVGVDMSWFRQVNRSELRTRLGFASGDFVVGFSGRLVAEKGLHDLASALRVLQASGLHVRGLLVGSGPLRDELFANKALFTIVTPSTPLDSLDYYAAMDCLVLPSRSTPEWKEQFGRSMVEAMSVALPVVGSSSGAIPEVIGSAGLVFPEGDINALSSALRELCVDRSRAAAFGELGHRRVVANYTNSTIAARTVTAYRSLLQEVF